MGLCAGAKDEVINNRGYVWHKCGKVCSADLIPGVYDIFWI